MAVDARCATRLEEGLNDVNQGSNGGVASQLLRPPIHACVPALALVGPRSSQQSLAQQSQKSSGSRNTQTSAQSRSSTKTTGTKGSKSSRPVGYLGLAGTAPTSMTKTNYSRQSGIFRSDKFRCLPLATNLGPCGYDWLLWRTRT